ncbi:amidohydrolase, partial [Staphylococcus cohnii]
IQNGVNEFIKTSKLDDLFAKYATEMGEAVIDDDFGYGSTDTGNVSHCISTIHPHINIGSRNLVCHTHRFREAAGSTHGDQALIRGAKILALMGQELIENKPLFEEIIEQYQYTKGHKK